MQGMRQNFRTRGHRIHPRRTQPCNGVERTRFRRADRKRKLASQLASQPAAGSDERPIGRTPEVKFSLLIVWDGYGYLLILS